MRAVAKIYIKLKTSRKVTHNANSVGPRPIEIRHLRFSAYDFYRYSSNGLRTRTKHRRDHCHFFLVGHSRFLFTHFFADGILFTHFNGSMRFFFRLGALFNGLRGNICSVTNRVI